MLRSTRIVMLLSIAVQAAALLRTMIIAAQLGASLEVDAYNLGIIAPSFITTVIGSCLQVAFVGKYAGLVATGELQAATAYRSRMLAFVIAIALITTTICVLLPDRIMALFVPDGERVTASMAADALSVTGFTILLIIVGDFIGLVLNSHGRFFVAAFAPLLNAAISVLVLWFWPTPDLSALVWSLLAGTVAQLAVVILSLISMRLKFSFASGGAEGEIVATVFVALPLLPAMMLSNSAMAILQFRSAGLGEGAVAILGYAMRLHNALAQILVIGFGTVLLPHFASLWARGEQREIILLLRRLARIGILVTAYLGGGIYLMGTPAVTILLNRGAFDAETADRVAQLWTVLSLSLFPFAFGTFIAKLCQAMRRSLVILVSGIISFAAIWTVSLLGANAHSLSLIASATTFAFCATAVFWLLWLSKTIEAGGVVRDIFGAFTRTSVILAPSIFLDLFLVEPALADIAPVGSVLLRGAAYTLVAASVMSLSGFQSWFFRRIES